MGCVVLRFLFVKGDFFFRVDFNSIFQFFAFCSEERNEVTVDKKKKMDIFFQ